MDVDYVSRLRASINAAKPCSLTSHSNKRSIFVHKDLHTCSQVFIRNDAVKKPLQPTYEGPYTVLERDSKTFKLQLPDRRSAVISIDRLKPAYTVDEDTFTDSPVPSHTSLPQAQDTSATPPLQPARKHPVTPQPSQAQSSIIKTTRLGRRINLPVRFR